MSAMTGIRAAAAAPVSPAAPLRLVPAAASPAAGPGVRPGRSSAARPRPVGPAGFAGPAPLKVVDEGREIRAICRSTVQAAIEVLAGTRPAQQLARRLDQRCLVALQHRSALTRRAESASSPTAQRLHRNPSVRSVRACQVSEDVYEASAVVVDELRVRAVAVRLERNKLVWRITALEIG
jgi:hypothetical protein